MIDPVLHHAGFLSLVPALLAVILAFVTREAFFSLFVACVVGVMIVGQGPWEVADLLQRALGTPAFIWILLVEICIGILVAFFLKTASTQRFAELLGRKVRSRNQVQLLGWFLGMLIFFSDYFSPLLTGPVMRSLTNRAGISREKLAYICDSTSAPMCVIVPFSAWSVYLVGLLVGCGPIVDTTMAMQVFIKSIPLNFYAFLAVGMVGLIASGIIPEFGPMRRAERRAMEEGKPLADDATPMMSAELVAIEPFPDYVKKPRLILDFAIPLATVVSVAVGTFLWTGTPRILEAFMAAVVVLGFTLWLQRVPLREVMATGTQGIKGVVPAMILLGLAYTINTVSVDLGTARFVVQCTEGWLTPQLLPALMFLACGFVAFSTGTSWGTYAIVIPIAVPLALEFSGGEVSLLLMATFSAVAGGGVFGDHCSPLSDTTILSSFGAASDHIDHVKTQLPYAARAAAIAAVGYLILGAFC